MRHTNNVLVAAVLGCVVVGVGCGGSTGVDVGDTNGTDASATAGNGGSGGSGQAAGGGGSAETGGSSSGAAGTTASDASVGAGGNGGAPNIDGGAACKDLISSYEAALVEAKRCNPTASAPTCQSTAPSSLPCPGCSTRVEDATKLTEIRMQWASAGCKGGLCPAIACILPGAPACIATDSGGGVCGSSGLVR